MNFLIKRYLIDFAVFSTVFFIGWMASIWFFDGLLPTVVGVFFFLFLIVYVPYVLYEDYRKIKEIKDDYYKMKNEEITKEQFHKNLIIKITNEFGVPEFVAENILNKIIKEKPNDTVVGSNS